MWARTTGQQKRSHFSRERASPCRLSELHKGLSLTEPERFLEGTSSVLSQPNPLNADLLQTTWAGWILWFCTGPLSPSAPYPSPTSRHRYIAWTDSGVFKGIWWSCFQLYLPPHPQLKAARESQDCAAVTKKQKKDLWYEVSKGKEYGEKLKCKKTWL